MNLFRRGNWLVIGIFLGFASTSSWFLLKDFYAEDAWDRICLDIVKEMRRRRPQILENKVPTCSGKKLAKCPSADLRPDNSKPPPVHQTQEQKSRILDEKIGFIKNKLSYELGIEVVPWIWDSRETPDEDRQAFTEKSLQLCAQYLQLGRLEKIQNSYCYFLIFTLLFVFLIVLGGGYLWLYFEEHRLHGRLWGLAADLEILDRRRG